MLPELCGFAWLVSGGSEQVLSPADRSQIEVNEYLETTSNSDCERIGLVSAVAREFYVPT
jgi:hypothetical protein